jgi:hypothetical protein
MLAEVTVNELRRVVSEAVADAMLTARPSPWLDSDAAAAYLGCTAGTMKTWRSRGEGPRFEVIQSKLVRYHVDQLDAFVRKERAR